MSKFQNHKLGRDSQAPNSNANPNSLTSKPQRSHDGLPSRKPSCIIAEQREKCVQSKKRDCSLIRTSCNKCGSSIHLNTRVNVENQCSENEDLSSVSSCSFSQFEDGTDEEAKVDGRTYRTKKLTNDRVIDTSKENCVSLNIEFNRLQERNGRFLESTNRYARKDQDADSDSSTNNLERKFTQIFNHRGVRPRKPANQSQKTTSTESANKENANLYENKDLKFILKTLKKIFRSPPPPATETSELKKLYKIVKNLQKEQEKFRNVIEEQQAQINGFQFKYLQAQGTIESQKYEIEQLCAANNQLENELNTNLNALKDQFQEKLNELSQLPKAVKASKSKCDKLSKENSTLIARMLQTKEELALTRTKLEEACQKRAKTLNKLKAADRDLKIFKSQNLVLKAQKRTLSEEVTKLRSLNDNLRTNSTKNILREKERGEIVMRDLRKKISDLEAELDRSRNSTNVLVEERDKLIADLHAQINTLVHNFEVSQKHIRILRRHIYAQYGNQNVVS